MGVEPTISHIPTDVIKVAEPDWFWSGLLDGDLSHSGVYDNTKIAGYVPAFRPTRVFGRGIYRILAGRRTHPELAKGGASEDAVYTRLVAKYERARAVVAAR